MAIDVLVELAMVPIWPTDSRCTCHVLLSVSKLKPGVAQAKI